MARKDINNLWDRDMRNAINDNFIELYNEYTQAGLNAKEAKEKAVQAVADSLLAKDIAETTRQEMINIIREQTEGGDIVPEVVQARGSHATVGDRLNSISQDLAQTTDQVNSEGINIMYPPIPLVGAKGDGITDDTEVIQTIIDYAISNRITRLIAPPKTFKLSADVLEITQAITIEGSGKSRHGYKFGTVFDFTESLEGTSAIKMGIESKSNIGQGLKDVMILGNRNIERGIYFIDNSYNNTLENIDIQGFKYGVYFDNTWNNVITKVTTKECEIGFSINAQVTSSKFTACLAYNAPDDVESIGWEFNGALSYTSLSGCGADGVNIVAKVTADLSSASFYNFGFEQYDTGWLIDFPTGTINIYGMSEYNATSRYLTTKVFDIQTAKRINLIGCNLNTGANELFAINKARAQRGIVRTYASQLPKIDSEVSEYVIQDEMPYNVLTKKKVDTNVTLYKGYKASDKVGGMGIRVATPSHGDTVTVKISAFGYSDVEGSVGGSESYWTIKNVNGEIVEKRGVGDGVTITASTNDDGKTLNFRFSGELPSDGNDLSNVTRAYEVTAIAYGKTAHVMDTSSFRVAES